MKRLVAGVVTGVMLVWSASASDHLNLEHGLPLQVEDAYAIAFRGREVQGAFRYDRTRSDENRLLLEPRVELGVARNTQVTLRAPFYVGNADRTGSGDIALGALYNFNTEGLLLPALAVAAESEFPAGKDSHGVDTSLKFIMTKSVSSSGLDRAHLNVAWFHNAGRRDLEREHRYQLIAGYSRRLAADWVFLADFVREQELQRREDSNLFEVGARWQVTPLSVVSFGAGAGVGQESPLARVMVGFQKSF